MTAQHRILLLDDDTRALELYREILAGLPSKPEIITATSGVRAIALLEEATFNIFVSDLNMPKMDGLQVLTVVRRRFPQMRTAVLTSAADEHYRARAYALGIDLFLEKPSNSETMRLMLDCVESLLGRDELPGFRGVQSKSLVDIIQLECLSQSSSVLKITHGTADGRIWIQNGEVYDAVHNELQGEDAFRRILSWKTGSFQILPEEPNRPRTIHASYQGLLLETAQAMDESDSPEAVASVAGEDASRLAPLGSHPGVEFVVEADMENPKHCESWGVENGEQLGQWTRETMRGLRLLGDKLQAGNLNRVEGSGPFRHVGVAAHGNLTLCAGFARSLSSERVRETLKQMTSQWAS